MRKALIVLMIGATALTPMAQAAAQADGRSRVERQQARTERQQARSERQQVRAERREQRVERRQQAAPRVRTTAAQNRAPSQAERRADRREAIETRRTERQAQHDQWRAQSEAARQYPAPNRRADNRRDGQWNDRRDGDRRWDGRRDGQRRWDGDRRYREWSSRWRNDRRYDWQRYRNSHRHIYRVGRYHAPYRWHNYQRFSIGFLLEPLFFSSRYWIGDPWHYRLPPAYPGTRWVRYYNDVLLVDVYTGEVVDVIYDFFW